MIAIPALSFDARSFVEGASRALGVEGVST